MDYANQGMQIVAFMLAALYFALAYCEARR
jgi:hypothetical protein